MDLERHRRVATSRLSAETRDDMGPGAVSRRVRLSRKIVAWPVSKVEEPHGNPWKIM